MRLRVPPGACTALKCGMTRTRVTCEGRTFGSVKELAEHYGKRPGDVAQRLRVLGWSPEQAVGVEPRRRKGTSSKPVAVLGVAYDSLRDAAAAFNLEAGTVRARLAKGLSIEEAFSLVPRPRKPSRSKPVTFRGKEFSSQEAMAAAHGQKSGNVLRRVGRGWTVDQALMLEPPPPRFRDFDGHAREAKWKEARLTSGVLEPVPDASGYKLYVVTNLLNSKEYVGITIGSLDLRLKQHFAAARRGRKSAFSNALQKYGEKGFRIELLSDAAKTFEELQEMEVSEIQRRNSIRAGYNTAAGGSLGTPKQVTVAGRRFSSYLQAAEHFGIDASVFVLRLTRLGWSPEEAAGLKERSWEGKKKPVEVSGVKYESLFAAARAHGVAYKLTHARVAQGWSLEQALGLEPMPASVRFSGRSIQVFGVDYGSIAEAARMLGISSEAFRKRLQQGATPEEAVLRARKTSSALAAPVDSNPSSPVEPSEGEHSP